VPPRGNASPPTPLVGSLGTSARLTFAPTRFTTAVRTFAPWWHSKGKHISHFIAETSIAETTSPKRRRRTVPFRPWGPRSGCLGARSRVLHYVALPWYCTTQLSQYTSIHQLNVERSHASWKFENHEEGHLKQTKRNRTGRIVVIDPCIFLDSWGKRTTVLVWIFGYFWIACIKTQKNLEFRTWGFSDWQWGTFLCKLYWATDETTSYCTSLHIALFAVWRYIGVKSPMSFNYIRKRYVVGCGYS